MNAPATQNGTAVAARNTFSAFMGSESVKRKIGEIIGSKKGDGFITSIVASVSNNPVLATCDNGTILSAGLQGAALDLSPSPALGHFYMVPFEDRKNGRTVATFQIGYKGYIQLAIRSGQYRRINVISLKEGELVSYNRLTEEIFTKLIEDDEIRDKTPTTGYYAMFELTNGFIKTMYWSRAKMEAHAIKYSKGYAAKKGYTFWEKDFDGMAFKTMLRQLLSKWGVMSIELQKAFESDMAAITEDGRPDYVDNSDAIDGSQSRDSAPPDYYPTEAFAAELAKTWAPLLASGKKKPEQAIAALRTKHPLSEEQVAAVHAAAKARPAQSETDKLIDKMRAAGDVDTLDAHADLIGTLPADDQANATAIYRSRRTELSK